MVAVLALPACETAGQSAAAGGLTGAAIGGLIGSRSGDAAEGALIGGALGALAGWGAHTIKNRQTKSAAVTERELDYEPEQGFRLEMRDADVYPNVVEPGETVTAEMEYSVLGAPSGGVEVQEARVLDTGAEEKVLDSEVRARDNGTWENALQFQVPQNVEPGRYVVAQQVSASGQRLQQKTTFVVETERAAAPGVTPTYRVSMLVE
jgi:hypothetical protein